MKPTFIFGSPRSGTSWLARIFDSHPDTLYRHEPDVVVRNPGLPFVVESTEINNYVDEMASYAATLLADRSVRTNGLLPQFRKSYRPHSIHLLRLGLVYSGRAAASFSGKYRLDRKLQIPDLIDDYSNIHTVLKSVDSLGRLPLLAKSVEDCNIIILIRHPCGVASSVLRGQSLGKMAAGPAYQEWLKLEPAISRNLTLEKFASLSQVEIRATAWLLFNEYVLNELSEDERVQVVTYEELCKEPEEYTKEIFKKCGLDYHRQTQEFIAQCMNYEGKSPRYFQVVRNPLVAANRWKHELSEADQRLVYEITNDSVPGRLFYR